MGVAGLCDLCVRVACRFAALHLFPGTRNQTRTRTNYRAAYYELGPIQIQMEWCCLGDESHFLLSYFLVPALFVSGPLYKCRSFMPHFSSANFSLRHRVDNPEPALIGTNPEVSRQRKEVLKRLD